LHASLEKAKLGLNFAPGAAIKASFLAKRKQTLLKLAFAASCALLFFVKSKNCD
jgi:hypothetical protein